jgi:hypothetical protein
MPNTYTELRKTTVGTATPSVTFDLTGISGYTDLKIVSTVRSTRSALSDTFYMRLNGDTGSNYSWTFMRGDGSSATSFRAANVVGLGIGEVIAANQTAGIFNVITTDLMNYSNTTTNKTSLSRSSVSASYGAEAWVSMWRNTAAVTSIVLFMANGSNIEVGSTFSLYGIANADQGAAKATGGMITEDSQYYYHTFVASGTFIPKQSLSCDVLVVAGGGGGGAAYLAGGGGAGGYRTLTSQSFPVANYSVVVGAGGAGSSSISAAAPSGIASSINSISSAGGGGGGPNSAAQPTAGGSGGGGGNANGGTTPGAAGNTPSTSPSQGNAGGSGNFNSGANTGGGGGGGGAGAVGSNGLNTGTGGAGGAGRNSEASWAAVTGTGVNGYYAGGGGGGGLAVAGGAGGLGGGAAGTVTALPSDATVNTGGGGGGLGNAGAARGGNGGSGIVIVRYAK